MRIVSLVIFKCNLATLSTLSDTLLWRLSACDFLPLHWSRSWSYIDHVTVHALITFLNMQWSRGWSWTDHVADHALITWEIIHWSRGWSCTLLVPDHVLTTWMTMHWSRSWYYTDHRTVHALIMWLIMHWTRDCGYLANKRMILHMIFFQLNTCNSLLIKCFLIIYWRSCNSYFMIQINHSNSPPCNINFLL